MIFTFDDAADDGRLAEICCTALSIFQRQYVLRLLMLLYCCTVAYLVLMQVIKYIRLSSAICSFECSLKTYLFSLLH